MNRLDVENFAQQLQAWQQRVAHLQQQVGELPLEEQQWEGIGTIFEEFSIAWEELQVAHEHLWQQNEDLFAAHEALEAERQRYRELFEFAPDAYLVTDMDGMIQEANSAAATLLNRPQKFLTGTHLIKYVVVEERQEFRIQLNRLHQVDDVQEWEVNLRSPDTMLITAAVKVAVLRNPEGHPVNLRWIMRDITQRKRTELELQQANERLQLAATALDGTLYDWDKENNTIVRTHGLVETLGYSREQVDLTPEWWQERIHPDDKQRVLRDLPNDPTCNSTFSTEYRIRARDGSYLDLWDRGLRIRNDLGQTVRVVGCTMNITRRKQAEESLKKLNQELENRVTERTAELEKLNELIFGEIAERIVVEAALQQREQQFRALVEHAPDIIERFDRELRHLYVNPAIEQLTGKPPTEFIGKTNRELGLSEDNAALWEQALSSVFERGREEQFEFSVHTPKGLKYYQTRLVPELDGNDNPVSVLGISRDITDHKLALEALRESEERFRQLAENIDEVFWMRDSDRPEILFVSPAYEEIWGLTRESLYEDYTSWLTIVHPDDRDRVCAAVQEEVQGEYDQEYRIVRSDGSMRWIRDRSFPIRDAQGRVYRLAGITQDITARKQAELAAYQALERERELSRVKSGFIAMTSHEFRNPLTTIRSSTELLERYRNQLSEEKQRTHLHRIQNSVERMLQLLNDILLLSKAEAGKLEFNPEPVDLVQFCRNLVDELQLTVKPQQAIVFTYKGDCTQAEQNTKEQGSRELNPSLALLDEKLLRHILSNLLSNASKYSPEGSTVRFDLTCHDGKAIFQIQDQGIGIPPEDQSRLFESFQRASNVGTIQGTGLGLAIVRQCVDLHRGEISFISEVGKGTRFTVVLPLGI